MEAVRKWKRIIIKSKIKSEECTEADLKALDLKDPLFTLFTCKQAPAGDEEILDHEESKEESAKPAISKVEHIRRIKEAEQIF